jgi:23S rRNA pseudouridine2604 synthase
MNGLPVRINKYLASENIASRREADELIRSGKVRINGRTAQLGDLVKEGDKVFVDNQKEYFYYAFNKPAGIVTHSPQRGERGILDIVKFPERVFPIGRLDKDSWGLILFTNDGRITEKILSPAFKHEKEYEVAVNRPIDQEFIRHMAAGVVLDDGAKTRKCQMERRGKQSFSVVLTEGKRRQIRRMCAALGYQVTDLCRVKIMNIKLGNLRSGRYRSIVGEELRKLKESLGI